MFAFSLGIVHKIELVLGDRIPAWERTDIDTGLGAAVIIGLIVAAIFFFLDALAGRSPLRIALYGLVLVGVIALMVTMASSLFTGGPAK